MNNRTDQLKRIGSFFDARWRRRVRRVAFWVPVVICFAIATTPSPGRVVAGMSGEIAHALAFTYLAFALSLAHFQRGPWWAVVAWLFAFGVLIEIVQFFVAGRAAELADVAVDVVGIGIGILVFAGYRRARERIDLD